MAVLEMLLTLLFGWEKKKPFFAKNIIKGAQSTYPYCRIRVFESLKCKSDAS